MKYQGDEDEEKDAMLAGLSGEVDDFAGKQLKDPDGQGPDVGGTTITITVAPGKQSGKSDTVEDEEMSGLMSKDDDEEKEKHDPIAHILGICRGGCPGGK
jgi:hypothetical protein